MIPNLRRPNIFLFIFLFAPFIKPVGLDCYPIIAKLYTLWKLLALFYLTVALLPRLKRPTPRKKPFPIIGLSVFWLIYLINCIIVRIDVMYVLIAAVSSIMLILLIFYETEIGNGRIMLRALSVFSTLCIVAHLFSVFLVNAGIITFDPNSVTPVYLFGVDNYSAFFLYPMVTIVLYYRAMTRGGFGLLGWGLLLLLTGIYLLTRSATAFGAGVILLMVLAIKQYWPKLPKIRNVRWVVAIIGLLLILICVFKVQELLASLLDAMSKGVTLNSRTIIWEKVLNLFPQKPLFGYGAFSYEQLYTDYVLYGTSHAHNLLLELWLRAGIIGTIAYLFFLFGFAPFGKKTSVPKAHGVLIAGLFAQLVLFFMDYYPAITIFYIFMGLLYTSYRFCAFEKPTKITTQEEAK